MKALATSTLLLLGLAAGAQDAPTSRPPVDQRRFHSDAVEALIGKVKADIADPETARTFENCFPNTLDTTVFYSEQDGVPDTYIITGDIDAMWLRDSSAQVNHYIPLAGDDEKLARMINGLIRRQTRYILKDPYANAFYREDDKVGEWKSDMTEMKPGVHERKWELDSLTYCIRLAWRYWKATGDTSAFDDTWLEAMQLAVDTMKVQQRKQGKGPYKFMRRTEWQTDTVPGAGYGNPWRPTGMICSTFRNSDDAATYLFNIPENLMAVVNLRRLAEMLDALGKEPGLAATSRELADEVEAGTAFSAIAGATLDRLLPRVIADFATRHGPPSGSTGSWSTRAPTTARSTPTRSTVSATPCSSTTPACRAWWRSPTSATGRSTTRSTGAPAGSRSARTIPISSRAARPRAPAARTSPAPATA